MTGASDPEDGVSGSVVALIVVTVFVTYVVVPASVIGAIVGVSVRWVEGDDRGVAAWSVAVLAAAVLGLVWISAIADGRHFGIHHALGAARRPFVAVQPVPPAPPVVSATRAVGISPKEERRLDGIGRRAALHIMAIGLLATPISFLFAVFLSQLAANRGVDPVGRVAFALLALSALVMGVIILVVMFRAPWISVRMTETELMVRSYFTTLRFQRRTLAGAEPALIDRRGGAGFWAMALGRTDDRWIVRLRFTDGRTTTLPVTLSRRKTLERRLPELNAWIGVRVDYSALWDVFDPDAPEWLIEPD